MEIYNGTGAAVDLSTYTVELYSNGAASPSQSVALSGTLADGDVFVMAHASADAAILAEADVTSSSVINFNGDDAVVLRKNGAVVDAFGQVGVDPGSQWTGGGQDDTLRRAETVCAGDTNPDDAFRCFSRMGYLRTKIPLMAWAATRPIVAVVRRLPMCSCLSTSKAAASTKPLKSTMAPAVLWIWLLDSTL